MTDHKQPVLQCRGVVRRFRELIWIVAGLAVGWIYALRPRLADATDEQTPADRE